MITFVVGNSSSMFLLCLPYAIEAQYLRRIHFVYLLPRYLRLFFICDPGGPISGHRHQADTKRRRGEQMDKQKPGNKRKRSAKVSPATSPSRGVSKRSLMRHKKQFNSVRSGVMYDLNADTGTHIKTLHRFAWSRVYWVDISPRPDQPTLANTIRLYCRIAATDARAVDAFFTTVSPIFKVTGTKSLADPLVAPPLSGWEEFELWQTRREVVDGKQRIDVVGCFNAETKALHPWRVHRVEALRPPFETRGRPLVNSILRSSAKLGSSGLQILT